MNPERRLDVGSARALRLMGCCALWAAGALTTLAAVSPAHAVTENLSTDLGTVLQATPSGLVFNRSTQTFDSNVVVKNVSTLPVGRPISLVLVSVPQGVVLTNSTAVTVEGSPFVTVPSQSDLAPGSSVLVQLKFVSTTNTAPRFDIRLLRFSQAVTQRELLQGPDVNNNGVRDDLEPIIATRYVSRPEVHSAAVKVLKQFRDSLGTGTGVEANFAAALNLFKAFDCMTTTAGDAAGETELMFLRDQMLNTRARITAWIGKEAILAGQSLPLSYPNPCSGN